MKTAEELRKIFKKETGINDTNSQGEPDIEYVWWLENRIIERLQQIELPSEMSPRVAKLILQMRDIYIQAYTIDDPNVEEMWHLLYQIASPNYDKLSDDIWSEIEKIAKGLNNK